MSVSEVLLVEDDPLVRAVLGPLLEELGFSVVVAEHGAEALERMKDQTFDAVVSDMKMPGMSGLEVLREARGRMPRARRVLISGYADDETRRQVEDLGGSLLHKPFGAEELKETVLQPPH